MTTMKKTDVNEPILQGKHAVVFGAGGSIGSRRQGVRDRGCGGFPGGPDEIKCGRSGEATAGAALD